MKTGTAPSAFIPRLAVLIERIGTIHWPTLSIAVASLEIIILLPRVAKRIPGSILALLTCTAFVAFLGFPVETIGGKFGGIPAGFPRLSIPTFKLDHVLPLFPSAMTVALLRQ